MLITTGIKKWVTNCFSNEKYHKIKLLFFLLLIIIVFFTLLEGIKNEDVKEASEISIDKSDKNLQEKGCTNGHIVYEKFEN